MIWIAVAIAATAMASAATSSAIVVDLVGKCVVTSDGAASQAHILLRLQDGDTLHLAGGAHARLSLCKDGHCEDLLGPCDAVVTGGNIRLVTGDKRCLHAVSNDLYALRAPQGNLQKLGGHASRPVELQDQATDSIQTVQVRPTMKHALTGTPTFTWDASKSALLKIRVMLHGEDDPLWTRDTDAAELAYDGPSLEKDTVYDWTVTPFRPPPQGGGEAAQVGRTSRASFVVLSQTSQEEVRRGEETARAIIARDARDPSIYVLLAAFYADYWMVEEARDAARKALALRPDDVGLHDSLRALYEELGDTANAQREREAIRRLRFGQGG